MLAAKWAHPMVNACCVGSASSDRLRLVFGRLGESPELGEAHDQPSTTEDRCRHGHAEIFVDPFGGQRREVVGGELDHALVVAAIVARLLEIACGEDAKPQVPEALRDLQGAGARRECLIQLVER